MDNIIECRLDSTCKEIYTGIWQHDYGQILRITGADLPKAVEVQFSLRDKGGDTLTRIGTTVDCVTEVKVPDSLLKNENCTQNYLIYAWIYVTDDASGNTEYQIILHVKSRPKPEEPTEEPLPEPNIFHETVEAVNASADRAEQALGDVEEIRDNLNLDLSEKITRPQTAEVGQVLAVKEIDESGKPTIFEAEDVKVPTKTSELENDSGFLTEHQDISGKLDKEKLPEAIDDALTQAKESGEFNGKDGAPGEKGEKGEPGEITYVENPYDDMEIKKEIAAKVGYLEVVGNQLLMYADDTKEKLLATLELPSGVEDVQINGTSIVENGIADIPAYWANTVNGIEFLNTKTKKIQLRLVDPSKKDISNRSAGIYQAINTLNYDYTVKSAMSAPIADTAGMVNGVYHYPAWTAEEQAAARGRIGIKWKQLVDVTTEENATKFIYTFDACNEIIVMISGNSTSNRIDCFSDKITNFYCYNFFLKNRASTNCIHIHPRICSMRYIECGAASEDTPNSNNFYVLINTTSVGTYAKSLKDKIDNLTFRIGESGILNAGSRIQVWGR